MLDIFRKNMKMADVILAIIVAGIALAIFLLNVFNGLGRDSRVVCIFQNGELVDRYVINEESLQSKEYSSEWGSNTVNIEKGIVYINQSTCPDHLCERMGRISKSGQVITCLPNRLQIVIEGDEPENDALNY